MGSVLSEAQSCSLICAAAVHGGTSKDQTVDGLPRLALKALILAANSVVERNRSSGVDEAEGMGIGKVMPVYTASQSTRLLYIHGLKHGCTVKQ